MACGQKKVARRNLKEPSLLQLWSYPHPFHLQVSSVVAVAVVAVATGRKKNINIRMLKLAAAM